MDPSAYTTADYLEELARVRRVQRRSADVVIAIDTLIVVVMAIVIVVNVVL